MCSVAVNKRCRLTVQDRNDKKMKTTDIASLNNGKPTTDPRLRQEPFRRAVRLVFKHLGVENSVRNFQKFDNQIAWQEFARNIQNPTRTARVDVLWHGEKSGTIITVKLLGSSRAEAIKTINNKVYKFIEWAW